MKKNRNKNEMLCSMVRGRLQRNYSAGKTRIALRGVLAYVVHFGLIKSCEQKHCGYQWQVAKAAMPMAGATNEL